MLRITWYVTQLKLRGNFTARYATEDERRSVSTMIDSLATRFPHQCLAVEQSEGLRRYRVTLASQTQAQRLHDDWLPAVPGLAALLERHQREAEVLERAHDTCIAKEMALLERAYDDVVLRMEERHHAEELALIDDATPPDAYRLAYIVGPPVTLPVVGDEA
jgi:hypothetical protein